MNKVGGLLHVLGYSNITDIFCFPPPLLAIWVGKAKAISCSQYPKYVGTYIPN